MDKIIISALIIFIIVFLTIKNICEIEERIKREKKKSKEQKLQQRLMNKYVIWNRPRVPRKELIPIIKQLWPDCDVSKPFTITISKITEYTKIKSNLNN